MNIKGDVTGGLTAGIIALPLALAFGIASGLGASAGLWGALVLGFFAAIFGGTKMQISGPTGPMSVVAAAIVFNFKGDMGSVMAVFVLTGIFQIIFGVLKLGKFVKYIPYSVISGFMSGVGFIIILLQINPMLGSSSVGNTLSAIESIPQAIADINFTAFYFAVATLLILYLTPKKISRILPTPLLAIIVLTPLCMILKADVATIGEIPLGLPKFIVPNADMALMSSILLYALMLAVLGSIDSLLTSLVADSITKSKHSPNKELIGQGIGNAFVGFVGGIPGAGATMRTVANIKAGGEGRISGVVHALFLLFVALVFAPVVAYVPLCVLAGILIKVGIDILDYRLLKRIAFIPRKDATTMAIVFLLTVFVDLIFAVAIGVVLAWLFYSTNIPKRNKKFNITVCEEEEFKSVKITGPMYFGTSSKIMRNLNRNLNTKHIKIDCRKVTFMDISSVYALEDFIDSVDENATKVSIIIDERSFSGRSLNELKYILRDNIDPTFAENDDE
ncbi:SulP family inorganic anion transporter [Campylobacter sp. RM9344]|uniref:SulP family inorganic anion transporter n=1 Tax=Campylobacter californiensis TaxID=1032243 RepID=A0AAW3ZYS8_9BACT|nr:MULTISPECIES: SulP family inorganic anion transporter [unclassified Campylobacter]MBE2984947.1 SulP family inorganic anion transporter [Campylobacter sp. RM6883]MBE2986706.1 SulP family inorganic anion transporter [Campylobacter sp. RM12919]MBE2988793.1 SulP family inorganic anion transporter [Campylobacter sp. RM12920]MBE2995389.1 SulP family inorganic anion transporter [Campylobacter sp. RM6913]MBE3029960.1 SulP family inorganic anion transporter [Campylobacter sp. RM9344]